MNLYILHNLPELGLVFDLLRKHLQFILVGVNVLQLMKTQDNNLTILEIA